MWVSELAEVRARFLEIGLAFEKAADEARGVRMLPASLWEQLAALGLFRHGLPGDGRDGIAHLAAALEGLSYGLRDAGPGSSVISSLGLSAFLISRFGTPEARARYLEGIRAGRLLAATAVTEPQGGSDARGLRTSFVPGPDGSYRLDGEKWSITNTPVADLVIVFARAAGSHQPAAFIVEAEQPGVDRSGALRPAGLGTSPTGRLLLGGVVVPATHLLGEVGEAITYLNQAFLRERLLLPFLSTGLMERILDESMAHAHQREVSGKPLGEWQYAQRRLTDMKVALEVTRSLAHRALQTYLAGRDAHVEASIAKFHGANLATELVQHAIKLQGSYGVQEGKLDHLLMTAMCGTIGGGTEEVQRNTIYFDLYREYRKSRGKRGRSRSDPASKPGSGGDAP
jgi:alkylation response protein AidB-like acyl-CoA dehydrogenase